MSDEKNGQESKLQEFQFIQYIAMLANSGMQHLGKMMNPITGKTEKNLDAARAIVDMLSMFKKKTEGNLTKEEAQVMDEALSNLQLNYADEVERAGKEKPKEGAEKKESGEKLERKEEKAPQKARGGERPADA